MKTKYRYWTQDHFPELTRAWFAQHGNGKLDPEQAFEAWKRFLDSKTLPSNEAKFKKALELAVGVTPGAVGHYLYRQRQDGPPMQGRQLGAKTIRDLDIVSEALGRKPDVPATVSVVAPERGTRRIALLAELAGVPSPRFHLTVLEGIVQAGEKMNFSVALHEVRQTDSDLADRVSRVIRNGLPHGVVWFRLTPDAASIKAMSSYSVGLPAVLVHANKLQYPPPVLAHIVPFQATIPSGVEMWARSLPNLASSTSRKVVVAAMRIEDTQESPFQPSQPFAPISIRQERVDLIKSGIEASGLDPYVEFVDDYSASQAYELVQKHPDVRGYVCLSDEIAVGVKQLLTVRGEETRSRILGFDGSDLARKHQIPSFNQGLPDLGAKVIDPFVNWFRNPQVSWPPYEEIGIELSLSFWV